MKSYDLWLFLDLSGYGENDVAKVIERSCRKAPEFRGKHGMRLYFEFDNKHDKASFQYTVVMELNRQGYRWQLLKEVDPNTPNNVKTDIKRALSVHLRSRRAERSNRKRSY